MRILSVLLLLALAGPAADWPGFRGDGTSVSAATRLPLHWSDSSNVAWRVTLAGAGQSSPVIRRDRVYVTGTVGASKEELVVQALDLATGREVWRFTTNSSTPEAVSDMHSQAAPTPVVAEDGVFALFESGDCFGLNHDGAVRWPKALTKETAPVDSNHGLGGSPVLWERGLFVPLDQSGPACFLALDRTTGRTLWKTERPGTTSWTTPVIARRGDEWQVVLSGGGSVVAYHPETGAKRWEIGDMQKNNTPSATLAGATLVVASGAKRGNLALDLSGSATDAPPELWRSPDASSGFASPLVYRGRTYFLNRAGVVTAADFATGKTLFDERLPQGAWASPVGAEGRVYVFGEKGVTTVLAAAEGYRPLATNELKFAATVTGVAVTDGAFVLRAGNELVRVGAGGN